jgi:hypothetical protein
MALPAVVILGHSRCTDNDPAAVATYVKGLAARG